MLFILRMAVGATVMWTSTQTSEAMERSLGKGKLKIRPMIFTKCVNH